MIQRLGRTLTILAGSAIVITAGCIFDDKPIAKPASPPADAAKPALDAAKPAANEVAKPPAGETASTDQTTAEAPFQLESGFTALSLDQFDAFGAEPETWKATEGGISCTGKPKGYLYSKQSYENFTWRLEYQFPRPKSLKDDSKFKGNTGFLVYVNGEHKLWPVCIEVQGKYVQMAAIKENGGADPVTVEESDADRQEHRKPVGEWNELEIVSKDGALKVSLNGTPISSSQAGPLTKGLIGIQAEDHPFEVRHMRIRAD